MWRKHWQTRAEQRAAGRANAHKPANGRGTKQAVRTPAAGQYLVQIGHQFCCCTDKSLKSPRLSCNFFIYPMSLSILFLEKSEAKNSSKYRNFLQSIRKSCNASSGVSSFIALPLLSTVLKRLRNKFSRQSYGWHLGNWRSRLFALQKAAHESIRSRYLGASRTCTMSLSARRRSLFKREKHGVQPGL